MPTDQTIYDLTAAIHALCEAAHEQASVAQESIAAATRVVGLQEGRVAAMERARVRQEIRAALLDWHAGRTPEGFLTILERVCPEEG